MRSGRPSILVVRGGAIGDFLLTLPVFAALRAHFPEAQLSVLGYPHIAELARAGGLVDEVRPIEARALASFFTPCGPLALEYVEFFRRFALIVSYLYDPDGLFQSNVARCTSAQFIAGPHRPDEARGLHATEAFLKPLERLAIYGADATPRLRLGPVADDAARTRLGAAPLSWLAAHPGSGSEQKNWPASHWAVLLEHVAAETDWQLLLVGGEAEGERLHRLAGRWPEDRQRVAQSLPLVELAYQLAQVNWFVGHDSGITHLAAALGRRSLVLWGHTAEAVWAPRAEAGCVRLIRAGEGLAELPPERVLAGLYQLAAGGEGA